MVSLTAKHYLTSTWSCWVSPRPCCIHLSIIPIFSTRAPISSLQDKEVEETALDAKKRRRLGSICALPENTTWNIGSIYMSFWTWDNTKSKWVLMICCIERPISCIMDCLWDKWSWHPRLSCWKSLKHKVFHMLFQKRVALSNEGKVAGWQNTLALSSIFHAERDPLHQGLIVERAPLRQRDFKLDLTSRVGKTQVVTNSTPLNQQVKRKFQFELPLYLDMQFKFNLNDPLNLSLSHSQSHSCLEGKYGERFTICI